MVGLPSRSRKLMPASFAYWKRLLLVIDSVSVPEPSAGMPMSIRSEEPESAVPGFRSCRR